MRSSTKYISGNQNNEDEINGHVDRCWKNCKCIRVLVRILVCKGKRTLTRKNFGGRMGWGL
jgi:hypothetical protein